MQLLQVLEQRDAGVLVFLHDDLAQAEQDLLRVGNKDSEPRHGLHGQQQLGSTIERQGKERDTEIRRSASPPARKKSDSLPVLLVKNEVCGRLVQKALDVVDGKQVLGDNDSVPDLRDTRTFEAVSAPSHKV